MSFENPTRLRIGMHANFGGKDYRLIGRVVLGETEDGETYYWNEFNLKTKGGSYADLVYEETERGGEWRLFTMFEPEYPLTATDAATKRVGDSINLTGEDVRITLTSSSRVYRIEGEAPEGIEVGAEANYFNAESGDIMQVVSWTGDEVEFYNGVNLAPGVVRSAFNLPYEVGSSRAGLGNALSSLSGSGSGNYTSGVKFAVQAAFVLFLFFLIFDRGLSCSTEHEASPVKHISAGTPPLTLGATGKWHDKNYRITTHAVVENARMGSIIDQHEYELTDDYSMKALLVCNSQPDAGDWILFEQFFPLPPTPTAQKMAAKNVGDAVELDGFTGKVNEIFRSTVKQADNEELASLKAGTVFYGLNSTTKNQSLLVRWNKDGIFFYRGNSVTAKKLTASFSTSK